MQHIIPTYIHIIYEKSNSEVQHKKYGLIMLNKIQILH